MFSTQPVRFANLMQFPSLRSDDFVVIRAIKFVFELITKLTINWWALSLLWLFEKMRFRAGVWVIKQIPNSLSYIRMVVIPLVMYRLIAASKEANTESAKLWLTVMVGVIALDALDGPCARDLHAVSEFGKRLDPASDKFCFAIIVLGYSFASVYAYSLVFCMVVTGFALWCLYTEYKLIRLAVGPFNTLLKALKQYDPLFTDPGAFSVGKIKFNLQMAACVVGWSGLVFFRSDPSTILVMILLLFAARSFGAKSFVKHQEEYLWLAVVYIVLECGLVYLRVPSSKNSSRSNIVDISTRLKKSG